MKSFIIASNNPHKVEELDRILNPLGIKSVTAKDAGINLSEVEETGETFAENARLKAQSAYKISGMPAVADDSGLMVDALNGAPGVFSARYAGENATDAEKISKLLSELKDVPDSERTAAFVSSICCILDDGSMIEVSGRCNGKIAFEPVGEGGFGYDPVFFLPQLKKTFAQLTAQEKNAVSHRGKALRAFQVKLEEYLKSGE